MCDMKEIGSEFRQIVRKRTKERVSQNHKWARDEGYAKLRNVKKKYWKRYDTYMIPMDK